MYRHLFTEDDMAINQQKILHVTQEFKKTDICTSHPSIIIWVKFNAEDFNVMLFSNYKFCKNQCSENYPYILPETKFSPYFLHTLSHLVKIQKTSRQLFHKNCCSDKHTLLGGINEILPVFSTLCIKSATEDLNKHLSDCGFNKNWPIESHILLRDIKAFLSCAYTNIVISL